MEWQSPSTLRFPGRIVYCLIADPPEQFIQPDIILKSPELPIRHQPVEQEGMGHAGVVETPALRIVCHSPDLVQLLRPACFKTSIAAEIRELIRLWQGCIT